MKLNSKRIILYASILVLATSFSLLNLNSDSQTENYEPFHSSVFVYASSFTPVELPKEISSYNVRMINIAKADNLLQNIKSLTPNDFTSERHVSYTELVRLGNLLMDSIQKNQDHKAYLNTQKIKMKLDNLQDNKKFTISKLVDNMSDSIKSKNAPITTADFFKIQFPNGEVRGPFPFDPPAIQFYKNLGVKLIPAR